MSFLWERLAENRENPGHCQKALGSFWRQMHSLQLNSSRNKLISTPRVQNRHTKGTRSPWFQYSDGDQSHLGRGNTWGFERQILIVVLFFCFLILRKRISKVFLGTPTYALSHVKLYKIHRKDVPLGILNETATWECEVKRPGALEIKLYPKHPFPPMEGQRGGKEDKRKPRTLKSLVSRGRNGLKLRHFCGSSSGMAFPSPSRSTPTLKTRLWLPSEFLDRPSISLTTSRKMECEISEREGRRYERPLIPPHFSNPIPNLKYRFIKFHSPWLLQEVVWGLAPPAILTKSHELKCSALSTFFF